VARIKLMTREELEEWMAEVRWIYAITYHDKPHLRHEYCLRREQDALSFVRAVATIWLDGYDRRFIGRLWRSLDVGDHYVWVHTEPRPGMEPPLKETILVNRAPRTQERLL
jgi:hypothetical protein